jgi:hypothetical protein
MSGGKPVTARHRIVLGRPTGGIMLHRDHQIVGIHAN